MEEDPYPDPRQFNLDINQAPRAVFFGALAVFPNFLENIEEYERKKWEIIKEIRNAAENLKFWLVMIWFGSTYVLNLGKMSIIKGGESK